MSKRSLFLTLFLSIFFEFGSVKSVSALNLSEYIAPSDSSKAHVLSTGECVHFTAVGNCPGGTPARMWKNGNWEQFCIKSDGIYRQEDTSGSFTKCTDGNTLANYTLLNDASCSQSLTVGQSISGEGVLWAPLTGSAGSSWTMPTHRIVNVCVDRTQAAGQETKSFVSNYPGNDNQCSAVSWPASSIVKTYAPGQLVYSNGLSNRKEVVEIAGTGGSELFYFEKGEGLVAFKGQAPYDNVYTTKYDVDPNDTSVCSMSTDVVKEPETVADRLPSTKSGAQTQIDNGARNNHSPMSSGVLASLLALIFKNDNGPEHVSSNTGNAVFSDPFQYQTNDDDGGPAYIPDQTTMESPGGIATEKILSLMEQTHTVDVGTKQKNQLDTSSIKQWRLEADKLGHGAMFDLRYTITKSQGEILDDFFNLESGVSPRALSEQFYGTEFVQDWMCRLMISSDHTKGDVLTKDDNLPLLDPVIGYRGDSDCTDVTENKFNKLIPNAANTEVDRSTTKSGVASPQPINASDVYCHQPFSCSNKYGSVNIDCSKSLPISTCEYEAYSDRLSKYILNSTKKNNANKYIINRCESLIPMTDNAAGEIDQNILDYAAKFCSNSGGGSKLAKGTNFHTLSDGTRVYDSNWDSLSLTERNYIIRTQKSQFYLCYGDAPYSCYVSIGFMPQLADSAQVHENLGCGQIVPASTIEDNLKTTPFLEHGVDFSDTAIFNDDPKVPTYAETYTNKEYFDPASWIYSSPFAGLAKLVNSLKCTVTWGDKTFNIAGVDIKLRVPTNGCRTDVKTQVLGWIYISSDVQKDYKCAVNYYDHLLPAADIEKIKAKNREICGWDDCALYTHNSYNSVGDKSDSLSVDSLYSVDTQNKTVNISDKDNQQHGEATIYDAIGWGLCGPITMSDSYLTPANWPKKNTSNCKDYRDLL